MTAFDYAKFAVDVLVAIGTLAVAAFTAFLAVKTRDLAVEGRTAQDQAERQHRQQLMPVCKVSNEQNTYVFAGPNACVVQVGGIRNSGPGPALNVRLAINAPGHEPGIDWAYLGPIGPGEVMPLEPGLPLQTPRDKVTAVTLTIKYEDVFGQHFQTFYMLDPKRIRLSGPLQLPKGPGTCDF